MNRYATGERTRMGEGGQIGTGRGSRLKGLRPFIIEWRLAAPRRFEIDPRREIRSILDHLN